MSDQESFVSFTNDEGQEISLEIIDYFLYDGEEYVVLADTAGADSDHDGCGEDGCGSCGEDGCSCGAEVDVYVMKVVTVDDDTEEFVPIDPDKEQAVLEYAQEFLAGEDDEDE